MNYICKKIQASDIEGCDFFFYESNKNYYLTSLQHLIRQGKQSYFEEYVYKQSSLPAKGREEGNYFGVQLPDYFNRIEWLEADLEDLPKLENPVGTIGILLMRSYVLSGDTAHYDAVIRRFTEHNIQVVPAFSGGLDARPAIEKYFKNSEKPVIDGILSLTGFSLVGGPAYNDSEAAVTVLKELNLPYVAAHPLEFQTLSQWSDSSGGLGPIETTMLVALPELDGAINPTVFAGRHGNSGELRAMAPCDERIKILAERCKKLILLKKKAPPRQNISKEKCNDKLNLLNDFDLIINH